MDSQHEEQPWLLSTKEEKFGRRQMRKLGNTFIGIGLLGVFLLSGVEPDASVPMSFYIHAGMITIFVLTMMLGVAARGRK